jgi:hypothetical protein
MYGRSATSLRLLALCVAWQIDYSAQRRQTSRRLNAVRSICAHDCPVGFKGCSTCAQIGQGSR